MSVKKKTAVKKSLLIAETKGVLDYFNGMGSTKQVD